MDPGRIFSRDECTLGDLFDMHAALLAQLDMLETVVAMLAALALRDHNRFEDPMPPDLADCTLDALADYLAEFDRGRQARKVAVSFLNAPE